MSANPRSPNHSPIALLPNELLIHIFLIAYLDAVPLVENSNGRGSCSPVTLSVRISSVSRLWRQLALSVSFLWSHISLNHTNTDIVHMWRALRSLRPALDIARPFQRALVAMLMERSRNSTISIHIAFESCVNTDQLREVVRGIAESATRWRTLALRGESAEGLVAVIQQCRGTSPSIEDVSIHGGLEWGAEVDLGGFFDGGEWEHALPDDAPKVVGLPRLRHLELHDFKRVERMPYAPNLLKLELCRVHVSLGQLLKTLGECTGLEKLYLIDATWTARQLQLDALYGASDNVPEDPASLPSPVLLRHLTRLAIVDSSLPCTSRLLESISFPTLRHLRFSFECSLGSMRECFDTLMKDNPPLISAHLSVFTSTAIEEEIVRLLWKMKSLERLYLWHGCGPSGRPSKHAESPMIHALTRHAKVDHVEGPDTGRLFLPRLTTLWSTTVLDPRALQYVVQTRTSAVFSVEGVQRLSEVGVNWPLFHFGTAVAKDIKRYVSLVDSREVGPFDSGEDCAGRSFYMES